VGQLWQGAFATAKGLGIKMLLGTESAMSIPSFPGQPLALNVFYSASRRDHFATTTQCDECSGLYTLLGVAGLVWSSADAVPGLVALSTYYNPTAGEEDNILLAAGQAPPSSAYVFVRIEGYALSSASQPGSMPLTQFLQSSPKTDHWAAAGAMSAAAAAAGFQSSGTIAYVLPVSNSTAATAQAYYEGAFTRLQRLLGDTLDTYWIWTPESFEWDKVPLDSPLVKAVVEDLAAAQAAHDAVNASFKLATCGWVVGPLGARWYMDSILPPNWSISSIDMAVGNTPVDPAYANITHHPKWAIPWLEDELVLCACCASLTP
jgi:hypothetical protein